MPTCSIFHAGRPINVAQSSLPQGLPNRQETSGRNSSVFGFSVNKCLNGLSQSPTPIIPGDSPTSGSKIPYRGQVIRHFTKRMYLGNQATLTQLPCELGGLLKYVARAGKRGGHQSNYRTKMAFTFHQQVAIRGIRPRNKRHNSTTNSLTPGPRSSANRATLQFLRVRRRGVFRRRRLLPYLFCPGRIIDAKNIGSLQS